MNEPGELKNRLDLTAKILLRCFILNFALILVWFCFFLIGGGRWGYEVHYGTMDKTIDYN